MGLTDKALDLLGLTIKSDWLILATRDGDALGAGVPVVRCMAGGFQ